MAVQTSYPDTMAAAYHGMIANTEPNVLISREVEAAAGLGFGVPVTQGTADDQVVIVSASTDEVIGITVRDPSVDPGTADTYEQNASALLMRKGVMWVTVTDAGGVSAGDPVWVLVADGTFSNADAGTSSSLRLTGSRWETSAANGALAKIRVNLDIGATAGA